MSDKRLQLAVDLTQIPTAAGREGRVLAFIDAWLAARPGLRKSTDKAGNVVITLTPSSKRPKPGKPLFITAHLDHPAFVVERIVAPGVLELSFRGGVMDAFFELAPITLHTAQGPVSATLTGPADTETPAGKHYLAELDDSAGLVPCEPAVGDVATWRLPPAQIDGAGLLHTHGCDDLTGVAAALCAIEELSARKAAGEKIGDVRVLLTRAEEIGFIGAIAACRLKTMPKGSRVLALENSRSFADSPLGGGPIVRVGDRMSIFTPWLTDACAARAEQIFGGPAIPKASQAKGTTKRPWQRKLMAGGACEASVYCRSGYEATCLCLPLGNYHNMPHLTELQAGTYDRHKFGPPRCEREFIHTGDFLGLIDLLVALGVHLPEPDSQSALFDELYQRKAYVLGERPGATPKPKAKPKTKAQPKTKAKTNAKTNPKPRHRRHRP